MSGYLTIQTDASDEVTLQKSRFIGSAAPCPSEKAALAHIARIRETYTDASHHCYAFIVGANGGLTRYSDDGEPSGTAGLPIMEVIRKKGLVNLCVVVTRFFGGILLGAGGLARAYTKGCTIALDTARIVHMEPSVRLCCETPYPFWDKIRHMLNHLPVRLETCQYAAAVTFDWLSKEADAEDILASLTGAANGCIRVLDRQPLYAAWPICPKQTPA